MIYELAPLPPEFLTLLRRGGVPPRPRTRRSTREKWSRDSGVRRLGALYRSSYWVGVSIPRAECQLRRMRDTACKF